MRPRQAPSSTIQAVASSESQRQLALRPSLRCGMHEPAGPTTCRHESEQSWPGWHSAAHTSWCVRNEGCVLPTALGGIDKRCAVRLALGLHDFRGPKVEEDVGGVDADGLDIRRALHRARRWFRRRGMGGRSWGWRGWRGGWWGFGFRGRRRGR